MEAVVLISAGYEWTCLHCETMNTEIEITDTVECQQCGARFAVAHADHAHEK